MWIVRARVSGGVTGTRESVLKANGEVRYFATKKEADAEAVSMRKAMNGPYAKAHFEYWSEGNQVTTFKDLNIGDKFKMPGGDVVYKKVTGHSAKRHAGSRLKGDYTFLVNASKEVVPEHGATAADILNSWGNL